MYKCFLCNVKSIFLSKKKNEKKKTVMLTKLDLSNDKKSPRYTHLLITISH